MKLNTGGERSDWNQRGGGGLFGGFFCLVQCKKIGGGVRKTAV